MYYVCVLCMCIVLIGVFWGGLCIVLCVCVSNVLEVVVRIVYCVCALCIGGFGTCGARCVLCIVYVHCVSEGLVHVGRGAYCEKDSPTLLVHQTPWPPVIPAHVAGGEQGHHLTGEGGS